jgi:molecular chaperone DnaJ
LTFEEISRDTAKKIKIKCYTQCDTCDGSGAKPGSGKTTCSTCHGRGEVAYRQGFFAISRTCPKCGGEGSIIDNPCRTCGGEGRVRGEKTIDVEIPAGVSQGQYLTLRGIGNAGPKGGPNGDVIVLIEEQPHKYFERHGDDILYDMQLSFSQAALGEEIEVPTLKGKAKITINPGTQSGKILRMRGKGIPHLNSSGAGDQLVRVSVYVPKKLTSEERRLIEMLAKHENVYPEKGDKGFFERVKEAFM